MSEDLRERESKASKLVLDNWIGDVVAERGTTRVVTSKFGVRGEQGETGGIMGAAVALAG